MDYSHNLIDFIGNTLWVWLYTSGLNIVLILIGMFILMRLFRLLAKRITIYAQDDDPTTQSEREKRAETLSHILVVGGKVVAITAAIFMILSEIGIEIAPLIAGAGIVGIAIGFGAQNIVKDIFAGFFLLMENQVRVGDVVKVGEVSGLVEKITLRIVILRDIGGNVHIIPNGKIDIVTNMTYGWSRALIDIGIAYKEDVDRVSALIEKVGDEMTSDENWSASIIEKPVVLGIDKFTDSQVTLRILTKTQPQQQWAVERELRRRIKIAFEQHGIEIPFPQLVITKK